MNPCFETATRLARAIRNGRLSSVEATEAHLERIARLNGPIKPWSWSIASALRRQSADRARQNLPGQTRTVRWMGVFGPLARSVEDLETALRIIDGPDGYDAEGAPVPLGRRRPQAKDLRIAFIDSNPLVKVSADTAPSCSRPCAAQQGRRQGEARRAQGARLAAGLGRLGRSLPVPGARPAAAGRARAHVRDRSSIRRSSSAARAARSRRVLRRARPARPIMRQCEASSTTTTPG